MRFNLILALDSVALVVMARCYYLYIGLLVSSMGQVNQIGF